MGLTETQTKIERAIRSLCVGDEPFTTADDIADFVKYSKQTVLNNVDEVLENTGDIESRTVGQANVYYVKTSFIDEIRSEKTATISRLDRLDGRAEYAEARYGPENSDFDFYIHWYDRDGNELEGYQPSPEEIGKVADMYASAAVAIRYHKQASTE